MPLKIISTLMFIAFILPSLKGQEKVFPNDWLGKWSGTLEIFAGLKNVNSLPMSLEISPLKETGTFTYYLTYGEGADALRPYTLKTLDAKNGHYLIDEANGIQIETFLLNSRLVSTFEVLGSLIQTSIYLQEEYLVFEIYAGGINPVSITGDTIIGADTIPPVQSFPINTLQRAVLTKN